MFFSHIPYDFLCVIYDINHIVKPLVSIKSGDRIKRYVLEKVRITSSLNWDPKNSYENQKSQDKMKFKLGPKEFV